VKKRLFIRFPFGLTLAARTARFGDDPASERKHESTGQCTAKGEHQSVHAALVATFDRRMWQGGVQSNQTANDSPADE
jgi:hypothetical protein